MIILITGATGFIGSALSARLASEGHSLRVLTRNPDRVKAQLTPGVKAYAILSEGRVPDEAMVGVEAVVHLAGENIGAWPWTEGRKRKILESRTIGTRRLVEAMGRAAVKPAVLVAASAVGYYGDGGDKELEEGSEPGSGYLAEVCVAWEREIFRATEMGIRTVAVRNGLVLGHGGALEKLLPVFKFGTGSVLGSGRQWWSWIHVEDTVGIFTHALTTESLSGVVNGTAPEPATQKEFAVALAKAVHRPLLLKAPAFTLRLTLGEMAATLLEGQKADAAKIKASGYLFRYPTLAAALKNITA